MQYFLWCLLLIIQNAAFTWVSRARNSGSLGYHAIASVFSNGVWFISQFILIGIVATQITSVLEGIGVGLLYTASTVTGSLLMHYVSMHYLERGKRKVGGAAEQARQEDGKAAAEVVERSRREVSRIVEAWREYRHAANRHYEIVLAVQGAYTDAIKDRPQITARFSVAHEHHPELMVALQSPNRTMVRRYDLELLATSGEGVTEFVLEHLSSLLREEACAKCP